MITLSTTTFKSPGGWVVDNGYLLAHGLGRPVSDASCEFNLESLEPNAQYHLWVYTRDWVAPQGPGRFQVILNGTPIAKEFGIGNGEWHWEDGGLVSLKLGTNEIRLHDLTGFEGRCAAIAFEPCRGGEGEGEFISRGEVEMWRENSRGLGQSPSFTPLPLYTAKTISHTGNGRVDVERWREEYDFVVVGGGYAGMCAAVAAARRGVKTALVQDRPVWGGNASSEVRVGPIGGLGLAPFPHSSDLAYELMELTHVEGGHTSGGLRPIIDNSKLAAWLAAEPNLTTYPCTRCISCTTSTSSTPLHGQNSPCSPRSLRLQSIICHNWHTGEYLELHAPHFADCTGDAILATLAGAEVRTTPESNETLKGGYGNTNFWTTRWTDHETSFPSCPWALPINESNWQVNRPNFFVEGDFPYAAGWNWESGFDRDAIKDAEAIRDLNFRAAYGMWDYLKNKAPDKAKYAKAEMDWMGHVLGKRAAVRIVGDYVLTEKDLVDHLEYPDGVVTTTWFLDLHAPHPTNAKAFPGESFRSIAYDDPLYRELMPNSANRQIRILPYAIPFRCFYSRNVENLWMAGKDISCTHVAMSSVRVENTTAQMGAMVGAAVSLCLANGWSPRELGENHFAALKAALSVGKVTSLAKRGKRRYQRRIGLKNEILYWLRKMSRSLKSKLKKGIVEV